MKSYERSLIEPNTTNIVKSDDLTNELFKDTYVFSFLDKNLKKVVVSVTEDKLLSLSIFDRLSTDYQVSEITLDQDHINFLASIMLEFTKKGNLDKLKKKLGQANE